MFKLSIAITLALSSSAYALPHLDLEMTSDEYQHILKRIESSANKKKGPHTTDDSRIKRAEDIGTRLSKWIALVNANRSPEAAIRLTSASTRRGIPIDRPNTYSPKIIETEMNKALADLPRSMRKILLSAQSLPTTIPVDDETFIKLSRPIDRQYQSAVRFKLVDAYRDIYTQEADKDVRGLYYLETHKITDAELTDIAALPTDKLALIKDALTKICLNSGVGLEYCKESLTEAEGKNALSEFYLAFIADAKLNWRNFFKIPVNNRRKDIVWTEKVATVPFNTPEIPKFLPYLQLNIEDEFRFKEWSLKLNFGTFPDGPVLKFEAGTVPHVNDLGGNEIVMDSNQPIEEYESQWTIRHEFGHVLGLPDCYHEFYDVEKEAYVNYQLDITDLMCSRAGNMNERIYEELKEAYAL